MSTVCTVFAQKSALVGTWQIHDTLISAGMGDTYRFYPNGAFNYDFGAFNFNSRLININGRYKINGDTIFYEVEKLTESKQGEISFGDEGSDYNNWTIIKDKYITTKLNVKKTFTTIFKLSLNKKTLTIEGVTFYKISSNPNAERDKIRFPQEN